MTLLQHLQITDKRTCWHGNAGGRLNADPQNVVSTVVNLLSASCPRNAVLIFNLKQIVLIY